MWSRLRVGSILWLGFCKLECQCEKAKERWQNWNCIKEYDNNWRRKVRIKGGGVEWK